MLSNVPLKIYVRIAGEKGFRMKKSLSSTANISSHKLIQQFKII